MADSAEDKKIQQQQKEKELAILEKSRITADEKTAAQPENNNKLTGKNSYFIKINYCGFI